MRSLQKLFLLLLLTIFFAPSYAAVNGVELTACSVFSEAEDKGDGEGDKKEEEEEEEPDCD